MRAYQADMFGPRPLARTTDPDTSKAAAASMAGAADTQRRDIYEALRRDGPLTADELDELLGLRVTSAGWASSKDPNTRSPHDPPHRGLRRRPLPAGRGLGDQAMTEHRHPRRCPLCRAWLPSWFARALHLAMWHGWLVKPLT